MGHWEEHPMAFYTAAFIRPCAPLKLLCLSNHSFPFFWALIELRGPEVSIMKCHDSTTPFHSHFTVLLWASSRPPGHGWGPQWPLYGHPMRSGLGTQSQGPRGHLWDRGEEMAGKNLIHAPRAQLLRGPCIIQVPGWAMRHPSVLSCSFFRNLLQMAELTVDSSL